MNNRELAKAIIMSRSGVAKSADFVAAGIRAVDVVNMCIAGYLERVRHGYYSLAGEDIVSEEQLLATLVPQGMDLRTWTENPVKNESKKKVLLSSEQIQKAAGIYHTWQSEGTDGANYAVPELYRSVKTDEIEKKSWSLVPSKYIEFIDHDLEIDYAAEMGRVQKEMREVLAQEMKSQKMLEDAFRGIGYGIE